MLTDVMATPRAVRKESARRGSRNLLVILNWGPRAWYRSTRASMTVGELRREVAKAVGRVFDGEVVGLELVVTDSGISPELTTSLSELIHPPHRNVCFDVTSSPGSPLPLGTSTGEYQLRRHLRQEYFQSGIDSRLWRLIEINWPHAAFGLCRKPKAGEYREAWLRLKLDKYPLAPPLVECWDAHTRSTVEATEWPEWFVHFVSHNYPQFADIEPPPYSANLLRISSVVAGRLKQQRDEWDVSKDLTQVLSRASSSFRYSRSSSTSCESTSERILSTRRTPPLPCVVAAPARFRRPVDLISGKLGLDRDRFTS